MDKLERETFDEAARQGVLDRLSQTVQSFCVPLWWEVNRNQILGNGTACVIATPQAVFGVTANHVLETYERHKAEQANIFFQLGNVPFGPAFSVIDRSKCWDLATIRIPDFRLNQWVSTPGIYETRVWPPATVKTDDLVIIGGYPKSRRSQSEGERPTKMFNDFVYFIGRVDSSSDDHFMFHLDSSNWQWPKGEVLPPRPNLGGLSGGPCFLIIPEEKRIELVGFIEEGQTELELVRVKQANLLNATGRIKPGL